MPADNAFVLTPTDVKNIRTYVQSKYAAMPHDERAEIVADAVTRIIHKQLPDFELEIKRQLTSNLIRTTVLEHQRPVSADDIYLLCMELDLEDERIAEPFRQWTREQEVRLSAMTASVSSGSSDSKRSYTAEVIALPLASDLIIKRNSRGKFYLFSTLSIFMVVVTLMFGWSISDFSVQGDVAPTMIEPLQVEPISKVKSLNGLPKELKYQPINRDKLIAFLEQKNSILAEPIYMDAIIQSSKDFDIHPVFLFAITGQEQGFVPRTHKKAEEIANNPFNVFHSWEEFNTTIDESSQIAARTIVRLSKDKPKDIDPFTWINREYAEDPNWSNGVRSLFTMITNEIGTSQEGN